MKNSDLLQLAILIVALVFGYNALQTIPYIFWLLYHWIDEGLTLADRFYNVALNFLYLAIDIVVTLVLIKRSKAIAQRIADEASFSADIKIVLQKGDVLYAALIIMGTYILATKLPKLLVKIYDYIWHANKPLSYNGPNFSLPGDSIPEFILTVVFATVMVVYAKTITDYFVKHIKEDTDIETIGDSTEEMI